MAGQVRLVVDADMQKAFAAFSMLWERQQRAKKGMDDLATAGDRAEKKASAATAAATRLVNRIQQQTRSSDLALSQADRGALRTGFNPGGGALGTSIERRMIAGQLRDDRAFARDVAERRSAMIGRSAGSMAGLDAVLARGGTAAAVAEMRRMERADASGQRMMYAASGALRASTLRMPGESAVMGKARRLVAGRLAGMADLHGTKLVDGETVPKVSSQDMENMVGQQAESLTKSAAMRSMVLGGAAAVAAAAGAMLIKGINNAAEQSQTMALKNVEFQDQITGLMGLGDNSLRPGALKSKIFANAIGGGFPRGEVVEALYQLQSTAGNLPGGVQDEIFQQSKLLTKVKGGSLAMNQTALVKMWQNYPGTFKNPKEASNFMAFMEEKGSINMEQLAKDAPDAFAAWKEAGYTLRDFAATVQEATTYTGNVEKAMIQTRNLPGHMLKAEKVLGIKFKSADYMDRIDQMGDALDKMGPDARLRAIKSIDDERGMIVGSILVSRRAELRQQRADFGAIGDNYVFEKYRRRLGDQSFQSSEITKSLMSLRENIPAMAAQEGRSMFNTESYIAGLAGTEWVHSGEPWVDPAQRENNLKAELAAWAATHGGSIEGQRYVSAGFALKYDLGLQAAAGATDRETYRQLTLDNEVMKLRHGASFGIKDADGTPMDAGDVNELLGLYGQGFTPTAGQLAEFHRLGGSSSVRAVRWLGQSATSVPRSALTPYAGNPWAVESSSVFRMGMLPGVPNSAGFKVLPDYVGALNDAVGGVTTEQWGPGISEGGGVDFGPAPLAARPGDAAGKIDAAADKIDGAADKFSAAVDRMGFVRGGAMDTNVHI